MNNCSLDIDWNKASETQNKTTGNTGEKDESFLSASHGSNPPSPSPLHTFELDKLLGSEIVQHILHILKTDKQCKGNDARLIMKVCERMGLCKYLRDSQGHYAWIFRETDINSGKIHSGTLETIRRYRQKINQYGLVDRTDEHGRLVR